MKKLQFSHVAYAVSASLLVGCGGESGSPEPVTPPSEVKAVATDGFSVVMPEENAHIDLHRYLRVPEAKVTDVIYEGENSGCGTPIVSNGGFQVRLAKGALCDYRYIAQYKQVSSEASFRVLASADDEPFLPNLSEPLVEGAAAAPWNLQTKLGVNWPSGYELDTVTVVGDANKGSVIKTAGATNSLTYTPRAAVGWDTIEYTLKNTTDETKVKTGSIFVTVSDEANRAPKINAPHYERRTQDDVTFNVNATPLDWGCNNNDELCSQKANEKLASGQNVRLAMENYNFTRKVTLKPLQSYDGLSYSTKSDAGYSTEIYSNENRLVTVSQGETKTVSNYAGQWVDISGVASVKANETIDLDLTALPGLSITDADGDLWKLERVQSFSANVAVKGSDSATNKVITFRADEVGEHIVSYIVGDNFGGYSSGLIKVSVVAKGGAVTWADINTAGNVYLAPLTYSQATDKGYLVSALWDDAVNNTVAGYKASAAKNYCSTVGSLPTVAQAQSLRSGPAVELAKWPKAYPYLVIDGANIKGFNLSTGGQSDYNGTSSYYVTCVSEKRASLIH